MNTGIEKIGIKKKCIIDEDFSFLEKDKSLSEFERARYVKELTADVFDMMSDYSREAYKSGQFGAKIADKKDGVRFFLNPGMYENLCGDSHKVTEFYGEDKYGTGYFASPERIFLLVRQAKMFEVDRKKHPYFKVHVTECSVLIGKNDDSLCVAHIGMSYRREVEGVLNYLKENGYYEKDIYLVASVGDYQEEMAEKIDNSRLSRIEEYEDLGILSENISTFAHEMVRDGEDNLHRNTTEVIITDDYLYKYSFDHRAIGGWFGMSCRNETRMIETDAGMEELEFWDEEMIEF